MVIFKLDTFVCGFLQCDQLYAEEVIGVLEKLLGCWRSYWGAGEVIGVLEKWLSCAFTVINNKYSPILFSFLNDRTHPANHSMASLHMPHMLLM